MVLNIALGVALGIVLGYLIITNLSVVQNISSSIVIFIMALICFSVVCGLIFYFWAYLMNKIGSFPYDPLLGAFLGMLCGAIYVCYEFFVPDNFKKDPITIGPKGCLVLLALFLVLFAVTILLVG